LPVLKSFYNPQCMYSIEYYISTSKSCAEDLAKAFSIIANEEVVCENGSLIFPSSFATGMFRFYELAEGLSLLAVDCTFHLPIKMVRQKIKSNDYHILHFNLSTSKVIIDKDSGRRVDIGTDWVDAIFYSTTGKNLFMYLPLNEPLRAVIVIATKTWCLRNFQYQSLSFPNRRLAQFAQDTPIQFTMNLDIRSANIAEEILTKDIPEPVMPLFLKGCVLKLLAFFNARLIGQTIDEVEKVDFEEVTRVMKFKEQTEKYMHKALPSLEDAARQCYMGKAKFIKIFNDLYGKTYANYFIECRLQKAGELLDNGVKPSDVSMMVGYSTPGGFSKEFKKYYNVTPSEYRERNPRNLNMPPEKKK
jgi:AraC-like DNA-binding protein